MPRPYLVPNHSRPQSRRPDHEFSMQGRETLSSSTSPIHVIASPTALRSTEPALAIAINASPLLCAVASSYHSARRAGKACSQRAMAHDARNHPAHPPFRESLSSTRKATQLAEDPNRVDQPGAIPALGHSSSHVQDRANLAEEGQDSPPEPSSGEQQS